MARYVVGDVQGCLEPLECLLKQVQFAPGTDELWFAGDLVNRGPDSLGVLRFARDLGDSAVCVLGNHDLHLLAVARGARKPHRKDTLDDILGAQDRDTLLDWLQRRPLVHHEGGFLMVHAGLHPAWDKDDAVSLAAEVEAVLRGPESDSYFRAMYGNEPDCWNENLTGPDRWRVITNYLTRIRICTAEGRLDLKYKRGLEGLPSGYLPWFAHDTNAARSETVLFGHWAAIDGDTGDTPNVFALDTGCVWGGRLRLLRLDDGRLFHCDCSHSTR